MEEGNSLRHDVFQVSRRRSSQDDQQAVGQMSQGSQRSYKFQVRRKDPVSDIEMSNKTRAEKCLLNLVIRRPLV